MSAFQLHFADHDILTPGDRPDVLVAMNPAALKANVGDLPRGADIIVNTDEFTKRNLAKVGYDANPLEDGSLDGYNVHPVGADLDDGRGAQGLRHLARRTPSGPRTCSPSGCSPGSTTAPPRARSRSCSTKFAKMEQIMEANIAAFNAGWNFGETTEDFSVSYEIKPAKQAPGHYRNISGNLALSYGLVAASKRAGLPLFLGSYPITPASDILHELSKHKRFGVRTFQAEDEIAAVGRGTRRGVRRVAGRDVDVRPGAGAQGGDDRSRRVARAAADHRRRAAGRPVDRDADQDRAGRPAAWRCSAATASRRCRSSRRARRPTASTPRIEAARIATTYRMPVILLSDGYLANGSEPWRSPTVDDLPDLHVEFATEHNKTLDDGSTAFWPYLRDPETLARPWAVPGTAGLEHRIGGIEKADGTGNISYDPANHDFMVRTRQAKIDGIAVVDPAARGGGPDAGRPACWCWAGARPTARSAPPAGPCARRGIEVAQAHLRHLNPFPANTRRGAAAATTGC